MRKLTNACLAVGLILGLAACSGPDESSDKKAKPAESSSSTKSIDFEEVAVDALVTTDMEMLSDHEPEETEPLTDEPVEPPLEQCVEDPPVSLELRDVAYQAFEGDPKVFALGFAVEGSAAKAFDDLREVWESKDCQSFDYDSGDDGVYKFKRTTQIKAPKSIGEEVWFGACFEATNAKANTVVGECRVIYLAGENAIGSVASIQPPPENELNSAFLTLVAAEALDG